MTPSPDPTRRTGFDALRDLLAADSPAPQTAPAAAAATADDEVVCGCNQVTAGELRDAVRTDGARSLAEVQRRTRASGGCGGCLAAVTAVVDHQLSLSSTPEGRS